MTNSPAMFQSMMDQLFEELIGNGRVIIYMDDILIHAKTKEKLEELTTKILQVLNKHNLYLKVEKCKFNTQHLEYLGIIITPNSIEMDPVKHIKTWPTPKSVKNV
jgi:hypothetical protein